MTPGTSPSVAFGAGRRPAAATHVTLAAFDGPLALLLAAHRGPPARRAHGAAGALADAYLDALGRRSTATDGQRLGAFVAVATAHPDQVAGALPRRDVRVRRALTDDGRDLEAELRARLILYRAFRDAGVRAPAEGRVGWVLAPRAHRRTRRGGRGRRPPDLAPLPAGCCAGARGARQGRAARRRRPRPSAAPSRSAQRHAHPAGADRRRLRRSAGASARGASATASSSR